MELKKIFLFSCFLAQASGFALISGRSSSGLPYYLKLPDRDILKTVQVPKCSRYMETCVPDLDECCGELTCRNILRDFCLYPLEQCRCNKLRIYQDVRR